MLEPPDPYELVDAIYPYENIEPDKTLEIELPQIITQKCSNEHFLGVLQSLTKKYPHVLITIGDRKIQVTGAELESISKAICSLKERIEKEISDKIITQPFEVNEQLLGFMQHSNEIISELATELSVCISPTHFTKHFTRNFSNKYKIELLSGDLSDLNADVYINFTNLMKKNDILLQKSGREVSESCARFLEQNGKLVEGACFVTNANKLGCSSTAIIIHANGISASMDENKRHAVLEKVVRNSLRAADKYFATSARERISLAFPALSRRFFAKSLEISIEIILSAVDRYILNNINSKISEIFLVGDEMQTIGLWKAVLERFSEGKREFEWYFNDKPGQWTVYCQQVSMVIEKALRDCRKSVGVYMKDEKDELRFYEIRFCDYDDEARVYRETRSDDDLVAIQVDSDSGVTKEVYRRVGLITDGACGTGENICFISGYAGDVQRARMQLNNLC